MPLYEYECKQCGHRFEKIQKFSDDPEKVCPKCNGEVERLLSAPAVQFKGEGWYVTDYAKKSGGPSKPAASESSSTASEKKAESTAASDAAKPAAPSTTDKKA